MTKDGRRMPAFGIGHPVSGFRPRILRGDYSVASLFRFASRHLVT
jgi:hypothetical protein